ncbi:MAG: cadmium-translocating P-type ATPase [Planctomycetes bacterium]|nr:cadmium-translocating P-type ATPase [Planctomycetota bacterium]MBI3845161.1 cadmium-translocating P-type ATPase [Planctomycetota bacterium]
MARQRATSAGFPIAGSKETAIALIALVGIAAHLVFRYLLGLEEQIHRWPLVVTLLVGGAPLVFDLARKLLRAEFGSDLLAGISIVVSVILGEYLAGVLVVLMLSGGTALESFALGQASSVLKALSKRMPSVAHRKRDSRIEDGPLDAVAVDDVLVVYPHETCPVDGVVVDGHGVMDESYLTGEPFEMSKAPGSDVLSGAINGESALTIRAVRRAVDSRYARIMDVMRETEQKRPRMRRLGDRLGAVYTPIAVALALVAWAASGDPVRFLAVLVVATPCPLLIAIPVAIIGAISLAARRSIIIKNPAVLEQIETCRTIILDKTGTLTYGAPKLTDQVCDPSWAARDLLALVASLENYSKHPLASAIVQAARGDGLRLAQASEVSERPGEGLRGIVAGRRVEVTGRGQVSRLGLEFEKRLPPQSHGLECHVLVDGRYAATYFFHDRPRDDSHSFVSHLGPKHRFSRVMLVSGDRETEVRYLAEQVGITEVFAGQSPEDKVAIVVAETRNANTLFLGDGINDAPALMAATVGVAFGQRSDITTEAAGAVIMDASLQRVDEFFHLSRRLRAIALQSAVGGMAASVVGMLFAAAGHLSPVAGALLQEVIDVLAVLNALRVALPPKRLSDY